MGLSVYLHVPFCQSRCAYCAFYSGEATTLLPAYPGLLSTESRLRSAQWRGPVSTVYFGGGTPSLLPPSAVAVVLKALDRAWGLAPGAEVTLEANPGASPDFSALRRAGVTRLSLGVQCLCDHVLAALARPHRAADALASVEAAARAGFESVSADLLFGLPELTPELLSDSVRLLREAGAHHVSTYALELHPGTPLTKAAEQGSFHPCSPAEEEEQWRALDDALSMEGYESYEVSNHSLPSHRCRHNLAYWDGSPYVGLGPGAHGYDPRRGSHGRRSWNDPGLSSYAQALRDGLLPPGGEEELTAEEALLEKLFLGLRRPVPLDVGELCRSCGLADQALRRRFETAEAEGLLRSGPAPGAYVPTDAGLRRADGLALWLSQAFSAPAR